MSSALLAALVADIAAGLVPLNTICGLSLTDEQRMERAKGIAQSLVGNYRIEAIEPERTYEGSNDGGRTWRVIVEREFQHYRRIRSHVPEVVPAPPPSYGSAWFDDFGLMEDESK